MSTRIIIIIQFSKLISLPNSSIHFNILPNTCFAGVKRLYDLVKFRDDALRVAFYFGLGNTLVAADLEQASRIAYGGDKRWSRVVTMQV